MIQKLKKKLIVLASLLALIAPAAVTPAAQAADVQSDINNSLKCGSDVELNKTTGCVTNTTDLSSRVKTVINIGSAVVGAIAVVMIIVGGARYVSSGGKQDSVTSAKNTIIYAIVGLIIVALAQAIVHFVLNNTTG